MIKKFNLTRRLDNRQGSTSNIEQRRGVSREGNENFDYSTWKHNKNSWLEQARREASRRADERNANKKLQLRYSIISYSDQPFYWTNKFSLVRAKQKRESKNMHFSISKLRNNSCLFTTVIHSRFFLPISLTVELKIEELTDTSCSPSEDSKVNKQTWIFR